jgi:hypothetical protein
MDVGGKGDVFVRVEFTQLVIARENERNFLRKKKLSNQNLKIKYKINK